MGMGGSPYGVRRVYAQRQTGGATTMHCRTIASSDLPSGDLWVFAYGSLIWQPGFDYVEARPATLAGAHRALCIYSFVHRGTRQAPGLVFGLERGGACRGRAYRIAASARAEVLAALRARELVTGVYREALRPVRFSGGTGERVTALAYLADREHEQYAGRLPLDEQVRLVRGNRGLAGANEDYVMETLAALEAMHIRDGSLRRFAALLCSRAASAAGASAA
jgi:cation transport protein ChaC